MNPSSSPSQRVRQRESQQMGSFSSDTKAQATYSSCELVPPCPQGNHGSYINSKGGYHAAKPIGKYYFTEDALKHDLAALKRGEIYDKDEFYKRAKAWYKAEIDRLLHLKKLEEEAAKKKKEQDKRQPLELILELSPILPRPAEPASNDTPPPPPPPRPPRAIKPERPPTRIQPPRAAKRKALDPPPNPPPHPPPAKRPPKKPRRKATPAPIQTAPNLPSVSPPPPPSISVPAPAPTPRKGEGGVTKGDYTLAAYDWEQYLNGNAGEHRPSPWAYVQLQGMDVAYFCMRLERAVRGVVEAEGVRRGAREWEGYYRDSDGKVEGEAKGVGVDMGSAMDMDVDGAGRDRDGGKREKGGEKGDEKLERVFEIRCALVHKYEKPAPFEPAAALAPGEDWRPPLGERADGRSVVSFGSWEDSPGVPAANSWAAHEVERHGEINKKAGGGQAPEAEMQVSPTLGRWPRPLKGVGGEECKEGRRLPSVEDLAENVVEVSGLRFAVDLCVSSYFAGGEEHARFLML